MTDAPSGPPARPSLQLRAAAVYLRLVTKPKLRRLSSVAEMRAEMAAAARRLPRPGPDACVDRADPFHWFWSRRRYPAGPTVGDARGVILYLHGGAYLAGSPETHRPIIWGLAQAADAPVAALTYRLAPEHPFPAAVDDAVAAVERLRRGGWPAERIALVGDSAGGGLALAAQAALGLEAVACVVAFSPFTDLTLSGPSVARNARRDAMLPAERIQETVDLYLNGADPSDPRASPLFADFGAPRPTLLTVGDGEVLLDDARRMRDRLRAQGTPAVLEIWPGAPHSWQILAPWAPEATASLARAGAFVKAAFAASGSSSALARRAPDRAGS